MGDNGPRILVVDDERAIRRFLRASLTAHGYHIFEAARPHYIITEPGVGYRLRVAT